MPDTIANWLTETILPLMRAGDISAIYIGDVIEAAPTPIPPIILKIMNIVKFLGKAVPRADAKKKTADKIRTFFLPSKSLSIPAMETPMMQPTRAQEAAHPVSVGLSAK